MRGNPYKHAKPAARNVLGVIAHDSDDITSDDKAKQSC